MLTRPRKPWNVHWARLQCMPGSHPLPSRQHILKNSHVVFLVTITDVNNLIPWAISYFPLIPKKTAKRDLILTLYIINRSYIYVLYWHKTPSSLLKRKQSWPNRFSSKDVKTSEKSPGQCLEYNLLKSIYRDWGKSEPEKETLDALKSFAWAFLLKTSVTILGLKNIIFGPLDSAAGH